MPLGRDGIKSGLSSSGFLFFRVSCFLAFVLTLFAGRRFLAVVGIPLLQSPIALHVDNVAYLLLAAAQDGIDGAVFALGQSASLHCCHQVLSGLLFPHRRQMFLGSIGNAHADESIVSGRTANVATAPRTARWACSSLSLGAAVDAARCISAQWNKPTT